MREQEHRSKETPDNPAQSQGDIKYEEDTKCKRRNWTVCGGGGSLLCIQSASRGRGQAENKGDQYEKM